MIGGSAATGIVRRLSTRLLQRQRVTPAGLALLAALALPAWLLGAPSPIAFDDIAARAGVAFVHDGSPTAEKFLLETMGGGVAVLDYDNDGRLDLFFVNGAALTEDMATTGAAPDKRDARFHNRLYRQTAPLQFEDATERAGLAGTGYGQGVAVGDFDNDDDADLYVTGYGSNTLYRNDGDGTFTDVTAAAGVAAGGWSASAAFVDVDADGRLDLFVTRYLDWSFAGNGRCGGPPPAPRAYCHPDRYAGISARLFRNDGDGRFTDVSAAAGIADLPGKALGVALADFDRDGRVDVFVANDSIREFLFRNQGQGRFAEVGLHAGVAYDQDGRAFAGMGVAFDDQDNDGWPDLLVTTLSNQLYAAFRNERSGAFSYATHATGLAAITRLRSGWGLALADADNDGWRDLLVAQGHVLDTVERTTPHVTYRQPMLVARNVNGRFEDVSATAGAAVVVPRAGRGLAVGDLDADGRLDLAVNVLHGPALVLRNTTTSSGHWLRVRLKGTSSNRDGIGATIELTPSQGPVQTTLVSTTGSYMSAHEPTAHFGLGDAAHVRTVRIRWPSGIAQVVADPAIDRTLTVEEPARP